VLLIIANQDLFKRELLRLLLAKPSVFRMPFPKLYFRFLKIDCAK